MTSHCLGIVYMLHYEVNDVMVHRFHYKYTISINIE